MPIKLFASLTNDACQGGKERRRPPFRGGESACPVICFPLWPAYRTFTLRKYVSGMHLLLPPERDRIHQIRWTDLCAPFTETGPRSRRKRAPEPQDVD